MAHYVASVNVFEHPDGTTVSLKVFRVFDYGAAPARPVWSRYIEVRPSDYYDPREWLDHVLESLRAEM